jgi:hypothetical protein
MVPVPVAGGVTTRVYWLAETLVVLAAGVPFVTVTAVTGKALTGWLKVKVKVTGPVAAAVAAPLMTTAGAGLYDWATAGCVALPPQLIIIGKGAARRATMSRNLCIRLAVIGTPWLGNGWEADGRLDLGSQLRSIEGEVIHRFGFKEGS